MIAYMHVEYCPSFGPSRDHGRRLPRWTPGKKRSGNRCLIDAHRALRLHNHRIACTPHIWIHWAMKLIVRLVLRTIEPLLSCPRRRKCVRRARVVCHASFLPLCLLPSNVMHAFWLFWRWGQTVGRLCEFIWFNVCYVQRTRLARLEKPLVCYDRVHLLSEVWCVQLWWVICMLCQHAAFLDNSQRLSNF